MRDASREAANGFHFLRLAKLGFQAPLLSHLALCPPNTNQESLFDDSGDVIQKIAMVTVLIFLQRLAIQYPISRSKEIPDEFQILWFGNMKQFTHCHASELLGRAESPKSRQSFVAFVDNHSAVQMTHLLSFGE